MKRTWHDSADTLDSQCKTLHCTDCGRYADAPAYGNQTLSTTCDSCSNGDA